VDHHEIRRNQDTILKRLWFAKRFTEKPDVDLYGLYPDEEKILLWYLQHLIRLENKLAGAAKSKDRILIQEMLIATVRAMKTLPYLQLADELSDVSSLAAIREPVAEELMTLVEYYRRAVQWE